MTKAIPKPVTRVTYGVRPVQSANLNMIEATLKAMGLRYEKEFKFDETRKFRFDFALPDFKIAIEYEGGVFLSGRHQRMSGFARDCDKYNLATSLGWRVLRFTAINFRDKKVNLPMLIIDTMRVFDSPRPEPQPEGNDRAKDEKNNLGKRRNAKNPIATS
jgi:very-short-patch-repair endonuclease